MRGDTQWDSNELLFGGKQNRSRVSLCSPCVVYCALGQGSIMVRVRAHSIPPNAIGGAIYSAIVGTRRGPAASAFGQSGLDAGPLSDEACGQSGARAPHAGSGRCAPCGDRIAIVGWTRGEARGDLWSSCEPAISQRVACNFDASLVTLTRDACNYKRRT